MLSICSTHYIQKEYFNKYHKITDNPIRRQKKYMNYSNSINEQTSTTQILRKKNYITKLMQSYAIRQKNMPKSFHFQSHIRDDEIYVASTRIPNTTRNI